MMEPSGSVSSAREKVVVAMSGGVDSCAAAILLKEQGYDIIGISMQVWDYRKNGGNSAKATCCAPADFEDARDIAEQKGFPYYVFDFEESFYDAVINPFMESYLRGDTPNPCLECNRKVKFSELRKRARALGVKKVATGHYAQIKPLSDGTLGLFTAVDLNKDQSYFLHTMSQQDLRETLFPVGGMVKPEVRKFLKEEDTEVSEKAESFDICFVAASVPEFIEIEKKIEPTKGSIVDRNGNMLGIHDGVYRYTVGQRKGLGVSNKNPLYVLQIDAEENRVIVGEWPELKREQFFLREVCWIAGAAPKEPLISSVKVRYRHSGVLCEVTALPENRASIRFLDTWSTVSPGQSAVFYATTPDDVGDLQVFGGGIIEQFPNA